MSLVSATYEYPAEFHDYLVPFPTNGLDLNMVSIRVGMAALEWYAPLEFKLVQVMDPSNTDVWIYAAYDWPNRIYIITKDCRYYMRIIAADVVEGGKRRLHIVNSVIPGVPTAEQVLELLGQLCDGITIQEQ